MQSTQVVILCGGYGTRIREYPDLVAKPMVPVGQKPILWHIMKSYSHYGFNDFIICLGFRALSIRTFFQNFAMLTNNVTLDLNSTTSQITQNYGADDLNWKVTLVDTGLDTLTGGRVKRVEPFIKSDSFFVSYGDTLCDINFKSQLEYHQKSQAEVTITGVNQTSRFGHITMDPQGQVQKFIEKPMLADVVSGGFFVMNKSFLKRLENDKTQLESEPLQQASKENKLYCYHHKGFWACMDTYREYEMLNKMYESGDAPWVKWKDQ